MQSFINIIPCQDIELLKEEMTKLSDEDARYHLDRCVRSGLWVPDANKAASTAETEGEAAAEEADAKEEEEEVEETYEEVK